MHVEVHQGTFVRLIWEFPDGDSNITAPYIHNGIEDGPEVNTPDKQPFLFYEIGNYTTSVTAYNNVSSAMVKLETTARYRIRGLCGFIVNMKEDNTTQGWNLTMAGTYFNFTSLITSGNEVEYLWHYGDGSDSVLWSPVLFYTHYYQTAGLYTVTVKADNIASTMEYSFQVEAVKPNMIHAPLYSTSDIPFQGVCDVTWHTGRGLTFLWDFGDGNTSAVLDIGEVWHYYTTFNTYTITCTIDDFPDVSDTFVIIDQDPVEGVKLDNITDIKATGDVVEFAVTWTRGNDVSFDWSFGEDEDEVRTNEPEVTHVYANTGFYDVIVNVSNVVSWMMSPPLRIELQERITGLRVTSGNNIIFADVAAQASSDTGNKIMFTYFFGDRFNVSSSSREESHRYSYPDLYTITVDAYNAVSLQRSQASVLIDSRITQGRVLVETPWIRADLVRANCWAMNGSSVWMNFDWGDGEVTGPYYANFVGTGSNFEGSHYYSKEGTFNITCYMGNAWSDAVARTQVLLQESIGSISFEPSVTVKGDIFYFKVLPFVGGGHDILFQWDYNDGSYYTSQDFTHPYVYSKAGIYYVKLTTTNLVSTKTVTQQLYVQEHVTGLYLSPVHPVEPGQPSIVTWQIEHGTDVEYQVDLGDDTDPYLFRQSVIGKSYILEYIYNYPGSYQVSLSVWNKLNSLNQTATAHVEYPIQGLRAYIIGNSTTHTDKSAFITIEIDQGTNVIFTCDYRDGSAPIVTTKMFCRHMFIALGYHLVTVSAENHLSSANCAANQSYEVILPPIPQRIENLEIVVERSTILGHVTVFRMRRRRGNRYNAHGVMEMETQMRWIRVWSLTYSTTPMQLQAYT
ncbi:putative polycystin-1 [Apostichopus japonicus]|uniref:Putative polycystin-1 n=1 Tax=Stichopus japonicus TaxID=307972 RepID=A0A2G8KY51_STIJA|nr:putative polycystin-1 [Apostichopus japonicus]